MAKQKNSSPNKMPSKDFTRLLAKRLDVDRAVAEVIIEAIQNCVLESIIEYDEIKVGNFIKFKKHHKPEMKRILNGETVTTPPYTGIQVKMGYHFKKIKS